VDILQIGRNDVEDYFYYVMELADDAVAESDRSPQSGTHAVHSSRAFLHASDSYVPKTLSKVLLQRGRLPVSECLELGLTLNLGLAHLHKAGLIHRDIKPSNIIFVGGVPKLADIGLVIDMSEARSFVGTEGFIPPEGPNSAQADLYSLGKVLYEAGMGKDRKDFPEPLTQIADAPDAAQLLEFNAVLLKACAASREERYQSAEAMNADLALLQSGGSVRRQRKLAGQLRLVQRMVTLTALLALVFRAGWWWQGGNGVVVQEQPTRKRPWRNAHPPRCGKSHHRAAGHRQRQRASRPG
jgi:serine/threonine protein kinase